jgi:hypothetical protein
MGLLHALRRVAVSHSGALLLFPGQFRARSRSLRLDWRAFAPTGRRQEGMDHLAKHALRQRLVDPVIFRQFGREVTRPEAESFPG